MTRSEPISNAILLCFEVQIRADLTVVKSPQTMEVVQ